MSRAALHPFQRSYQIRTSLTSVATPSCPTHSGSRAACCATTLQYRPCFTGLPGRDP